MASLVSHTSIDCADAYALSEWWRSTLGYTDDAGDPNDPGDEECLILDPDSGHRLLFIEVPDAAAAKRGKNRLHLDLRPRERRRDDEVGWLLTRGATLVADHRGIHGLGTGWVILADPEGNEFCVLRSQRELDRQDDDDEVVAPSGP
ncbi:VOC family protein [Nocardioides nanhaiensis]|uniref:VOC family protein n=1 Tax=Nocardioides nanhaiensis TaxID=1476871 RepID=A0ABP8W2R0_9ACTN